MQETIEVLDFEEAKAMLPDKERVYTFRMAGPAMIGANIRKDRLLLRMQKALRLERSRENAARMGHGLMMTDEFGPLFIETKEERKEVEDGRREER